MALFEFIALLITSIILPFVVALIRNNAITGSKARWLAIGISILAGVAVGFIAGIPASPAEWLSCIVSSIGGVQLAYTAFKSIGITSKVLDSLMEVGTTKTNAPSNPTPKIGGTDD